MQAGASDRGRDFAARWAEIIFVTPGLIDVAVEFRNDLHARAVRFGRDPDTVKVLPGIVPVIGDTEKQAKALHDQLHELSHPESGLSTLSYHLGVDLSRFPQDEVLPENLDVPGVEGHYREVAELTRRSGFSLAELGQRYARGEPPAASPARPARWLIACRSGSRRVLATASCCRSHICQAAWRSWSTASCRSCNIEGSALSTTARPCAIRSACPGQRAEVAHAHPTLCSSFSHSHDTQLMRYRDRAINLHLRPEKTRPATSKSLIMLSAQITLNQWPGQRPLRQQAQDLLFNQSQ
ncbi:LLM class flavin-dependent oxidoreductase [Bradyrhizobium valentinum]|uniref:LLM class flavin-dependent oxidoreductase n=1 Tax=Bradyrhizobium valentinum TaxID=1518501 RepID=UPI001FD898B6|nr:LLM class flavin-dependent oxidoreductase [Bradyrhizobium valentinum]